MGRACLFGIYTKFLRLAEDESLARWKASLGITGDASGAASGPKVCVTCCGDRLCARGRPSGDHALNNLSCRRLPSYLWSWRHQRCLRVRLS